MTRHGEEAAYSKEDAMQWVVMMLIGWIIFTAAVAYALIMLGLGQTWVGIIVLGMLGIGIMIAVSKGKTRY